MNASEKKQQLQLGIDMGGTKIEAVVLDQKGASCFKHRTNTPRDDYHSILKALNDLVTEAEHQLNAVCSVGIGMPGSIDPHTGLARNSNIVAINGRDLNGDLNALLRREVRIANDANCFALSEAVDGAGKEGRVVYGVILGTGCGGGLIIDKKVWNGANGLAGEWGHIPLPFAEGDGFPGPECFCGRRGCLEKYISGTGFELDFTKMTGKNLTAPAIVDASKLGDPEATAAIERLELRIARSLGVLVDILDPDYIVFGGGLSKVDRLYQNVPNLLHDFVLGRNANNTRIVKAVHGDAGGVRGAAWLWPPVALA